MHFSRTQWLCAALSLFVFAGLALGEAGIWPLEAFDRAITDAVPALRTETLNLLMLVVTALGDSRFLVFAASVTVLALLAAKAWREALLFGAAFALMPLIVKLLKMTIARPRPTVDLYGGVESFSFPSGHATNSALIYGALALLALAVFRKLPGRLLAAAFAGLGLASLMLTLMSVVQDELRLPDAAKFVPFVLILLTAAFPLYLLIALPEARELYTALHAE